MHRRSLGGLAFAAAVIVALAFGAAPGLSPASAQTLPSATPTGLSTQPLPTFPPFPTFPAFVFPTFPPFPTFPAEVALTVTATPEATATAEVTATATPTATPTATLTATVTATPTAPATLTATSTATPTATVTPTATPVACLCTLFDLADVPAAADKNDGVALEVGIKFRTDVDGQITALRFYKTPGNTGGHEGRLYAADGTLLAAAPYIAETASGWQQVALPQPVAVHANAIYVATYYDAGGGYTSTVGGLSLPIDRPPLHAPSNEAAEGNGVFRYGEGGGFPIGSYQASNYWVDVVFIPSVPLTPTPTAGP